MDELWGETELVLLTSSHNVRGPYCSGRIIVVTLQKQIVSLFSLSFPWQKSCYLAQEKAIERHREGLQVSVYQGPISLRQMQIHQTDSDADVRIFSSFSGFLM